MKKAFTLVELITVMVLIGALSLIVVAMVSSSIRETKEKAYDLQVQNIYSAAANWYQDNYVELGDTYNLRVTLAQLKQGNYISDSIINTLTDKEFPNDMLIEIDSELDYKTVTFGEDTTLYDDSFPFIDGEAVIVFTREDYLAYDPTDVIAYDSAGNIIDIHYTGNIPGIATTEFSEFKAMSSDGKTMYFIQNVVLKGNEGPTIEFNGPLTLTVDQALCNINEPTCYDLFTEGVKVDDSLHLFDGNLSVEVNIVAIPGTYTIKYSSVDSENNETTAYREVIVTE